MDAKDLRTETALSERNNDGSKYSQSGGITLNCDRNKSYQEIGSNSLAKLDVQSSRPCAVIGPDRVVPPVANNDVYLKKVQTEPWPPMDNTYATRRPPEYPHKLNNFQNPTRNISPRQTFQENMQRIMMPPSYNSVKISEDANYVQMSDRSSALPKNIKINMPPEAKFCDVPYTVYPPNNEQKSARNPEMCLPNANPTLSRTAPPGWPPGNVNIRPTRMYGASELYQYQEFPSCAGPRPGVPRPNRTVSEDQGFVYADSFYHQEGNIRFKPYPTVKERYPQQRYEYIGNYANSFHPPPPFPSQKYELSKTVPPHPYPPYPPIKYLDRVPEPVMDGFQRTQQGNYNIPYRNQIMHPNYGQVLGNCPQNKLHSYPPDSHMKPVGSSKVPFDNTKPYIEYDNGHPKMYPTSEGYVINEMGRMHAMKGQVIMPSYPTLNMHNIPPNTYYKKDNQQIKNYEYMQAHYRGMDPNMHNPMLRHPPVFSPNTSAISPTDSSASNDNLQTLMSSQEDCGYASQSSTASIRSIDSGINRIPNDYLRKYYDSRFGPIVRSSSMMSKTESKLNNGSKEKKNIDVRQFLQMWNEGDEETDENNTKDIIIQTGPKSDFGKSHQSITQTDQEQLYVLGLVNVPSEELGKYEHIQKVSKLPENIKGYNHIELLNQFEEAIEFSNMTGYKTSTQKDFQVSSKVVAPKPTMGIVPPRPLSPLDVEAKISQSVIHKEVGCNFEIKPCSPKMLNVEVATPVQNVLSERAIEKVANPVKLKSPRLNGMEDNIDFNMMKRKDHRANINTESVRIPSCKMVNTQFSNNNSIDSIKNSYSLQDLESNSGLCLASLPRLDNDIELNFPEVNQQFINANKVDVSMTNSLRELPSLELLDHVDSQPRDKKDINQVGDIIKSPCTVDTDKEFSKLSKYRKNKSHSSDPKENLTYQIMNAARTDSVIIKNPENSKNYEDKSLFSPTCLSKPVSDIQQVPINLTSQITVTESMENKPNKKSETILEDTPIEIAIDFSLNKNNNTENIEHNDKNIKIITPKNEETDSSTINNNSKLDTKMDKVKENDVQIVHKKTLLRSESNETSKERTSLIENLPIEEILLKNDCLSPKSTNKEHKSDNVLPTKDINEIGNNSLLPIQIETSPTELLHNGTNSCIKNNLSQNNHTESSEKYINNNAELDDFNISNSYKNLEILNDRISAHDDIPTSSKINHEKISGITEDLNKDLNISVNSNTSLERNSNCFTESIDNDFNESTSYKMFKNIKNSITKDLDNDLNNPTRSKSPTQNCSNSFTKVIDDDFNNLSSYKTSLGNYCENVTKDIVKKSKNSTVPKPSLGEICTNNTDLEHQHPTNMDTSLEKFSDSLDNGCNNTTTLNLPSLKNTISDDLDNVFNNTISSEPSLDINIDKNNENLNKNQGRLNYTSEDIGLYRCSDVVSTINLSDSKLKLHNRAADSSGVKIYNIALEDEMQKIKSDSLTSPSDGITSTQDSKEVNSSLESRFDWSPSHSITNCQEDSKESGFKSSQSHSVTNRHVDSKEVNLAPESEFNLTSPSHSISNLQDDSTELNSELENELNLTSPKHSTSNHQDGSTEQNPTLEKSFNLASPSNSSNIRQDDSKEVNSALESRFHTNSSSYSITNGQDDSRELNSVLESELSLNSPSHSIINHQDESREANFAPESEFNLTSPSHLLTREVDSKELDSRIESELNLISLNGAGRQSPNYSFSDIVEGETFDFDSSAQSNVVTEKPNVSSTESFKQNLNESDLPAVNTENEDDPITPYRPKLYNIETCEQEITSNPNSPLQNNIHETTLQTSELDTDFNMDICPNNVLTNDVSYNDTIKIVTTEKETELEEKPQFKLLEGNTNNTLFTLSDSQNINAFNFRYLSYGSKALYSPFIQKLITLHEGVIDRAIIDEEKCINNFNIEEMDCDIKQCPIGTNNLNDGNDTSSNIETNMEELGEIDISTKSDTHCIETDADVIIQIENNNDGETDSNIDRENATFKTKSLENQNNTRIHEEENCDEEIKHCIYNDVVSYKNSIHNQSECSKIDNELWNPSFHTRGHGSADNRGIDKDCNHIKTNSSEKVSDSLYLSNDRLDSSIEIHEEIYTQNNSKNSSPRHNKQLNCSETVTEEGCNDSEQEYEDTTTAPGCDEPVNEQLFQNTNNDEIGFEISNMQMNFNNLEIELSKFNEISCTKTRNPKHKFLNKKRQPLKRSLSDTALNSYEINSEKETEENFQVVWPFKRKKINNVRNDLLTHDLCNIIHNNRRNSISTVYNEDSVSFCILIDEDCIIAEEDNGEQEKICYAELQEDCLAEIENCSKEEGIETGTEVISITQLENDEYSDSLVMQGEEEKIEESWVDDVACMETVISEDIAENIEISGPSSPNEIDILSDIDESGVFSSSEHTDRVKYIYGEKMCSDDAQFVETLYNTPQMNVNKTLNQRETLTSNEYYDNSSLEKILSESNDRELSPHSLEYNNPVFSPTIADIKETVENKENMGISIISPLKSQLNPLDIIVDAPLDNSDESLILEQLHDGTQDDTVYSCESSGDNVFKYKENDETTNYTSSSSPEVSSTTSEEKNSGILLKITSYKGSRISQINDIRRDNNRPCCKFTEDKDYVQSHSNFSSNRPLLTKAAQKYIPPLKESIRDLKVKLSLPQHSLLKLKQLKKSKDVPKLCTPNISVPRVSKKPKPKFEDVLKSLDEIQIKMHKEKSKKSKKSIPKVVIKKNEHGSHYASTSKDEFNPDLTGRKWQPWVFIEKNHFIDKMAIKKKNKAIYSHRKRTYVLAEKFQKYKSASTANFVISPPISDCPSTSLKYTIRLKHTY